ncbi:kinase-like protein [Rhizophagus irregularis]|uniref:Kinase-like protein n=1 Tax=Rhizophagus irregularis TaxID=588596 RepID=A0A2N0SKR9_9GLOM|nr:kinase-like protein [Rhizophagus irregularis]PKC66158.1 kinase-like protein [Rhizophagus irregularis]PKC76128.1 kinase-like protein [Rhizophagus irregularis]
MVLGYANEGNLRSYLKVKFDSLEWGDKIRMALDITCGLKCLHSKKIIHRDLHSKNILVNNGRLLIADFGLSKHLTDATSNSMGNRTGITEYIDPRCFRDFKYVRREKSDIYSLGILLWEITSGRPPFHDDNVSQAQDDPEQSNLRYHIGYLNLREKPIDGTPLEYQQLYQKCWDGDPEKRPDVNQVYNEILCQYNADDIHEKHEDFSSSNSSNSHDNLNISSDYSEPYLGSEFD